MTEYLVIYQQDEGDWGAYAPDLPGCIAVGKTRAEVEKGIGEAIPMHVELMRESGLRVPEPRHIAGSVPV
ncbi:MAG TPA: type II toxin-antitoxin system HicB family antitoxin [Solirubrobacteraceae bacterium]|nr:type II toxin-antitoxin system HicB family antitoxin [Solirubrobacteraceae bacterium]